MLEQYLTPPEVSVGSIPSKLNSEFVKDMRKNGQMVYRFCASDESTDSIFYKI